MVLLSWLKSWKLWLAIGLVLFGVWIATTILDQAKQVGALEADIDTQQLVIEGLGIQLGQQERQHEKELAARDAAIVAAQKMARDAEERAVHLEDQFTQARATDADIDACMGMPLPAGIADSLRQ